MHTSSLSPVEAPLSLCLIRVDTETFGIETSSVICVLRDCAVQRVPLAPHFIGGVIAYRGDVLPVVCSRRLLALDDPAGLPSVVIVRDPLTGDLFGLAADDVRAVKDIDAATLQPNPPTLDDRRALLYAGAYRADGELVVRLLPEKLTPAILLEQGIEDTRSPSCKL